MPKSAILWLTIRHPAFGFLIPIHRFSVNQFSILFARVQPFPFLRRLLFLWVAFTIKSTICDNPLIVARLWTLL